MKKFFIWVRFEKNDNLRTRHGITLNQLQSLIRVIHEKPAVNQADKKLHTFCGTHRLITVFGRDHPKPDDSSILSHITSFTIHHNNNILLSIPMPPNWSIPFRCSEYNSVQIAEYPSLPNFITLINLPIKEIMHKNWIWGNVIHIYQK